MSAAADDAGAAPVLSVRDLSVALPAGHDRTYAVEDLSFDLMPAEILVPAGVLIAERNRKARERIKRRLREESAA